MSLQIDRRRLQRQIVTARSLIEDQRHLRLRKLSRLLNSFQTISDKDRTHAIATVHALVNHQGLSLSGLQADPLDREFPSWPADDSASDKNAPDETATLDDYLDKSTLVELDKCPGPEEHEPFSPDVDAQPSYDIVVEELAPGAPITAAVPLLAPDQDLYFQESPFDLYCPEGKLDVYRHTTRSHDISILFHNLYRQYQQSTSLRPPLKPDRLLRLQTDSIPYSEDVDDAIQESKIQHSMTLEEGKLWQAVASAASFSDGDAASMAVSELADRSHTLAQSYERRTRPPTADTYRESQMMLSAMGIPYVQSSGSFEAEGLAASLVIHGFGDYVATEDTVSRNHHICPSPSVSGSQTYPRMSSCTERPWFAI